MTRICIVLLQYLFHTDGNTPLALKYHPEKDLTRWCCAPVYLCCIWLM
ncbi:unnamed protein product [Ixodes pacificus]